MEKEDCLLSIIIPVYQAQNYLRECLDSVLNQNFADFELILVNDGSTDSSGEICEEYAQKDSRIKLIHKENGGQAAARNDGIKLAKGKYIGFVDNDDQIEIDMFDFLLKYASEYSDADIISCSYSKRYSNGKIVSSKELNNSIYLFDNKTGVKEILSREKLDIYVWTKIYKKNYLDINNIKFENDKIDEDILFNFQAYKNTSLSVFISSSKYIYSCREDSTSMRYGIDNLDKYLRGTIYRTNKILEETKKLYPDLVYIANRQKIIYYLKMLDTIIFVNKALNHYYLDVIRFLKDNKKQILKEREGIGVNKIGLHILFLLPPNAYFWYRRIKKRINAR